MDARLPTVTIVFDGGAIGNPGRGYGSYQITWPDRGSELVQLEYPEFGDNMTNNQAEYETLIRAIDHVANHLGGSSSETGLVINGDSKLVLNQLAGNWKVRNQLLRPFHARATELIKKFGRIDYEWHERRNSVRILGH